MILSDTGDTGGSGNILLSPVSFVPNSLIKLDESGDYGLCINGYGTRTTVVVFNEHSFTVTLAQAPGEDASRVQSVYKMYGFKFTGNNGGGTDVIANPPSTPTDTLETVQIGETVYDIAGSAGGASGKTIVDTLWSGSETPRYPSTYTANLVHSIKDYDFIVFDGVETDNSERIKYIMDTTNIVYNETYTQVGDGDSGMSLCFSDDVSVVLYPYNSSHATTYTQITGLKFGGYGNTSDSSEIISIEAGNDTTTRTFTFAKQPQFIKFYWGDPVISGGWATDAELVWGQTYMNYRSKAMGVTISQVDGGIASITYSGNKSFIITGANAFGAMNTSNGSGYMYVDYGSSIVTTAYEDIAEGEWTSLLTQVGGSWSAATAIPTDTTHIAMMVNYQSTNYEPMILRLAELDKTSEATGNTHVKGGYQWQVGSDYDKVAYDYDSANKTISVYAGYNGLSVNVFSIKADTPANERNSESRTDILWSGSETTAAWVSPIVLDNIPLNDYDMLGIQINDTQQLVMINQIPTGDNTGVSTVAVGGFANPNSTTTSWCMYLNRTGETFRIFTATQQSATLTKIIGIKFANAKANPACYSEAEREVGTWTDGKPLYQRTFDLSNVTLSDNAWTNNVLGTSGINIKKFEGYFGLVGYSSRFPLNYYRNNAEYFTSVMNGDNSDLNFRPNMNAGVGVRGDIVTIWYTKNSDVAGSGMYTSTGTPTVHYSTVEHVVGTWIDGKTLYERSYPNISITSTNNSIQTGISFDTLVDIEANGYKIDGSNNKIRFGASYNDGGDRLDVEGVNNNLRIICTNWFIGGVANITIRYTKSTT